MGEFVVLVENAKVLQIGDLVLSFWLSFSAADGDKMSLTISCGCSFTAGQRKVEGIMLIEQRLLLRGQSQNPPVFNLFLLLLTRPLSWPLLCSTDRLVELVRQL